MTLKNLIFVKEKNIQGEPQFSLINFLTEEEIERIKWALDYEEIQIVEKREEVRAER